MHCVQAQDQKTEPLNEALAQTTHAFLSASSLSATRRNLIRTAAQAHKFPEGYDPASTAERRPESVQSIRKTYPATAGNP